MVEPTYQLHSSRHAGPGAWRAIFISLQLVRGGARLTVDAGGRAHLTEAGRAARKHWLSLGLWRDDLALDAIRLRAGSLQASATCETRIRPVRMRTTVTRSNR